MPAAKFCQNFGNILGVQKPTWAHFLEFGFFCLRKQDYVVITRTKISWFHIILIHKSYNEVVYKILK